MVEDYPDLKASSNFQRLQDSLVEVEDALQNARRYYNATVRDLNSFLDMFPFSIIGKMANIKKCNFFEATAEEKNNIEVQI